MAPRPEMGARPIATAHGTVDSEGKPEPSAERARSVDVLIVSLGATGGLRVADDELLASLRRAGATAAIVRPVPPHPVRTLMLTDLRWAWATRRATLSELQRTSARAIVYSSTTAALFWPSPGAIRFDALAAGNRPGRHGLWQRALERRRLREAPLLLPWSEGALAEAPSHARAHSTLTLPVPVEPGSVDGVLVEPWSVESASVESASVEPPPVSLATIERCGLQTTRDIAAFAYAANPSKKGLDRILEAWSRAHKPGEELVVAGAPEGVLRELGYALPAQGVRVVPMLPYRDYRALLRRTRVFVCAARREDYGIAQLEALADGCLLVTKPSPGPYAALPLARELDSRLVGEDLATALRVGLDDPLRDYPERALRALAPFRRAATDRLVAEQLLPRLLQRG